ncbi:aspartate aminotransferase [Aspergillus ambiguus]|uniref:aspartate aminotransferase n=1 Tax=Aspergillus ambiguus TaxID=176160 RepID=UPI003CCD1000
MLSSRGKQNAETFNIPWRYAHPHTYDKETNPKGVISFGLAEHSPLRSDIAEYITNKVVFTEDSVGYKSASPAAARLPRAAVSHLNQLLQPITPIDPAELVVASGVTAIGSMLAISLAEPSDGILVSRPVYGRFELDYGIEAGVQMVYADTDIEEVFSPAVVDKYEVALEDATARGVTVRAVMVVNPHNPVGRCYPVETLRAILEFCNKHRLHFISDEIYASCVFDSGDASAHPFTSILSLSTPDLIDPNLVHVLYGLSKDFASGGLRVGFLITKNAALRQSCKSILRLHNTCELAVTATAAIFEDSEFVSQFTAKSQQHLAKTYRIITSKLDKEGIDYIRGGNAGFFVYVDLSPYLPAGSQTAQEKEFALAQSLLDAGVFLHPGEEHSKSPGWFRMVFSQDQDVLEEGLRRMLNVLRTLV